MPVMTTAPTELLVGIETTFESPSPTKPVGAVFEDDGGTGYFYALDFTVQGNPIVDALHIYNAADIGDRDKPSRMGIIWSEDGTKAGLVLNNHLHAMFDFTARRGYCHSKFPPALPGWTRHGPDWPEGAFDTRQ